MVVRSRAGEQNEGSSRLPNIKDILHLRRQRSRSIWLLNESSETFTCKPSNGLDLIETTRQHNRDIRINSPDYPQRLFAAHDRHRKIKQNKSDRRLVLSKKLNSFASVHGGDHGIAISLQSGFGRVAHER